MRLSTLSAIAALGLGASAVVATAGGIAPQGPMAGITAARVYSPCGWPYGVPYIPGYKPAFAPDDGRLNPCRGPRTAEGDAQMAQAYNTRKLPMVQRTGG